MSEIVYQFSNPSVGINFFTASEVERDELINNQPNFNFLGASYFTADPDNGSSSPVFRLFDQSTGSYFYTISAAERDNILNTNPNFISDGEAFSAFANPSEGTEEVYRFFNLTTGTHFFTASETERQSLETNPNFQSENVAFYVPPIAGVNDTPPSEDPIIGSGEISGFIFNDRNRNGFRDSELVQGGNPDLVFVIDVSGSTDEDFVGTEEVGDVNGDGRENTILDAELAGFIGLNQQLIQQNIGDNVNIGIVVFGESGVALNMIPGEENPNSLTQEEEQIFTITPNTDNNADGVPDVEEILSESGIELLVSRDDTFFSEALAATEDIFSSRGTLSAEGNVIFLSDGIDPSISSEDDSLVNLRSNNVNISAFGIGEGANLANLQVIDPEAQVVTSTDEFLATLGVIEGGDGQPSQSALDPLQEGVTVYLDLNNNGAIDLNEPTQQTDVNGEYRFTGLLPGTYTVRQVIPEGFEPIIPPEALYTVELADEESAGDLNFANGTIATDNPGDNSVQTQTASSNLTKDNFTGASLQVQALSPDLDTPLGNAVTTTVGDGIEYDNLTAAGVDDTSQVNVDIDVAANTITLSVDNDDGSFGSFDFNGYRFRDFSNSIAPITNVSIDPDTSTLGLSNFDIDFTSDIIEIDFSGLSFVRGDSVTLNVEFGEI